jgi:hypothetical protein
MVLLLVVGLVAVIIVILIAVILSIRLGRSDDRDEPTSGPSERGYGRPDADDTHWRDERASRRPPAGAARPARNGQRPRPQAQDGQYRTRDGRTRDGRTRDGRPDRGQARPRDYDSPRARDYDSPQGRPAARYDTGPTEQMTDPRRPVAPGARRAGSGRDYGGRRSGPYDTGPAPRQGADFPSEPLDATDFPSAEYLPASPAGFPSGEYPLASPPAADAATAAYRTARPRSDEFPSEPLAAADFASGEFPAADFPSEEMPAARSRGRTAPAKAGPAQDRSDSRRRPAKVQNAPKGRSRKRDDDDWPSMEWDKLSDEQYWAQLSSDKPLATTARNPQPAIEPRPAAAKNGRPRPPAGGSKPPVPASQPEPAAGGQARSRDPRSRRAQSSPREAAATQPREPVTQPSQLTPPREPVTQPSQLTPPRETVTQLREPVSQPRTMPTQPTQPARPREAVTERLPARPRHQRAAARARNDVPTLARPDETATPPAGEPSLAMLASLASRPGRAVEDPLTSPTFAQPTPDSRSYHSSRRGTGANDAVSSTRVDAPPVTAATGYGSGAHDAHGHAGYASGEYGTADYANGGPRHNTPVNGAYQVPEHADPGYAYVPAAPAAQQAGAPQPDGWYSAPTHTPAQGNPGQGNPYGSYVEPAPTASYPSIPPVGYQDQATGPAYPGDHDGYRAPAASGPYPGQAGAPQAAGPPVHPSDPGQFPQPAAAYPEAGYAGDAGYGDGNEYPGQDAYADSYGDAGYAPSYPEAGYAADQYQHDGYGGYPAGQG